MNRGEQIAALSETPQGVRLDLVVSPGKAASSFPDRYDPWRKRIGIRVRQPAENGRANQEVVRLVARFFDRPEHHVEITNGLSAGHKSVVVQGVSLQQAIQRLAGELK